MEIGVVGAGAWGTALALAAHRCNAEYHVSLWVRNSSQAQSMLDLRENTYYFPDVKLPNALNIQTGADSLRELATSADLIVIATPVAGLREMLTTLRAAMLPQRMPIVAWACKGFERPADAASAGLLPHEILRQVAPDLRAGVLSGPSFALEVARAQPTALVAASDHSQVCEALVRAFHSPSLRVYANDDLIGTEVGGAVKNVLAIATGLADGLKLGLNARAALITRGLAEITRLGVAMGARTQTFMGLSGLGDLVLTATGDLSRNRRVGIQLAMQLTLGQAVSSLGHVAEGVYSAHAIAKRAAQLGVEMPITECVVGLLDGLITPEQAVTMLMGRDPRREPLEK
jgi:glycerol-3-phosphate dehydrogenase (NAD(P)+)